MVNKPSVFELLRFNCRSNIQNKNNLSLSGHIQLTTVSSRVVCPPVRPFGGPSLSFDREVLPLLEASSGVGAFFSSANTVCYPFYWVMA